MNPIYYVTFTTAVLCASFILFQGFNTADTVNTISLICGFLIIFSGVYLLNLSRMDPTGHQLLREDTGIPTDGIASVGRLSMQSRRSVDHRRSLSNGSISYPGTPRGGRGDQEHLMHGYDIESGGGGSGASTAAAAAAAAHFDLEDLAEDSVGEAQGERADALRLKTFANSSAAGSPHEDGKTNGNGKGNGFAPR